MVEFTMEHVEIPMSGGSVRKLVCIRATDGDGNFGESDPIEQHSLNVGAAEQQAFDRLPRPTKNPTPHAEPAAEPEGGPTPTPPKPKKPRATKNPTPHAKKAAPAKK